MKERSVPKRKDEQRILTVLLQSYNQVNTKEGFSRYCWLHSVSRKSHLTRVSLVSSRQLELQNSHCISSYVPSKHICSSGQAIMQVILSQNTLEPKTDHEKCCTQIIASQNETSAIKSWGHASYILKMRALGNDLTVVSRLVDTIDCIQLVI